MTRTHRCNAATAAGRLRKALSFHEVASNVMDLADDVGDVGRRVHHAVGPRGHRRRRAVLQAAGGARRR